MNFLSSALGDQNSQLAGNAFSEFLQPYDAQAFGDLFQKSFVDPATQTLQRQIIPAIKENFLGLDERGSGSLNRALAQSATDLSTSLGSQYMNFYNQQQGNKLKALSSLGGLAGQRTFEPNIQQNQGILGAILEAIASVGLKAASGGMV